MQPTGVTLVESDYYKKIKGLLQNSKSFLNESTDSVHPKSNIYMSNSTKNKDFKNLSDSS